MLNAITLKVMLKEAYVFIQNAFRDVCLEINPKNGRMEWFLQILEMVLADLDFGFFWNSSCRFSGLSETITVREKSFENNFSS
ncbi:hypothetical protein C1645_833372 [Glomus cerebriforme]|uniref:Uncharacterized protein n=1 Tax=Glomus cerebriforme TaxID=658196 RepID=A0A397SIB8_9GLOM|nr:hypothetical protein C1645_833372 [Glomus cerebriforme]